MPKKITKKVSKTKPTENGFTGDYNLETGKPVTKKEGYNLSIKLLGKTYTSTGDTVREGLEALKPYGVAKGTSILSISKGEMSKFKVLGNLQTSRLFSPSRLTREVALKNISIMFDL